MTLPRPTFGSGERSPGNCAAVNHRVHVSSRSRLPNRTNVVAFATFRVVRPTQRGDVTAASVSARILRILSLSRSALFCRLARGGQDPRGTSLEVATSTRFSPVGAVWSDTAVGVASPGLVRGGAP